MEILKALSMGGQSSDGGLTKLRRQLAKYCRLLLLGVALAASFSLAGTATTTQESLEYAVKGAFLFKFGSFVEWPSSAFPNPDTPFVIGILGKDPFGASLDQIVQGRTVQGRVVVIQRLQRVEQAKDVHILFVARTEMERAEQIAASLRGNSVLTVSDVEQSLQAWMINLVTVDNKVRFEIDEDLAQRAGLKLSSKLLSLAKAVRTKSGG